jgi:uncharacterized membrane protein YdjX (TVP38/TMEM64 family)
MVKPPTPHRFWNRPNGIALTILICSLLVYRWLSTHSQVDLLSPNGMIQAVQAMQGWGIAVYISVIALSVVISPIPGAPLTVAAGAVWGAIPAGIYSVIGGFLGGLIAYFIGKTLGRSAILALTGKIIYFSKQRGEIYLGWVIFFTRLLPVLSFDLISYAAGLTGLSLPIYATATLLGMIPSTFFLTYLGSAFAIDLPVAIGLTLIFWILLIGLPWGMQRYNWFGMKDIIRVESISRDRRRD